MDVSSCGCVLPNNIPGYDGVSRISGGPEGQGTARASAVLPAGNASPCSLCCCIATSLLRWKRVPHGACRSVLRLYHARKFKDDQAPDKEKNVRVPAFYRGNAVWGHGLRRRLRYSPDSGPLLRLGKRNPPPLFWEKEGKGRWRSWCTAGRRRIFCVRPSLKTLRKPFGPKALRTLKGYIMAVSRRSRHLLRKAQNESGGFSMRKLIAVTYDTEFKA